MEKDPAIAAPLAAGGGHERHAKLDVQLEAAELLVRRDVGPAGRDAAVGLARSIGS